MDIYSSRQLEAVSLSDIGSKKPTNQDRLLVREIRPDLHLLAVIDGLGGQAGGEEAAETALAVFQDFMPDSSPWSGQLQELLLRANEAIIGRGDRDPALYNMCTTATLALITENRVHWAHIGDSRLYSMRRSLLCQVTEDHNLAWEMCQCGEISEQERLHHKFNQFLCQCLGEDDIEPASGSFAVMDGDLLLLCTDGVHDMIDNGVISDILTTGQGIEEQADMLLSAALAAGGRDNISLILVRFQDGQGILQPHLN